MTENAVAKEIVDVAYRMDTVLGPGLFESVYEAVLASELQKRGLSLARQQPIPVVDEGTRFEMGFRADRVVEDKVIVEIKSVAEIAALHKKQLLTHLRLADKRLGLLIHFNVTMIKTASRELPTDWKSEARQERQEKPDIMPAFLRRCMFVGLSNPQPTTQGETPGKSLSRSLKKKSKVWTDTEARRFTTTAGVHPRCGRTPKLVGSLQLRVSIQGVMSGFDRVLFRGSLRRLTHSKGMKGYLAENNILCKQYKDPVKDSSQKLKEAVLEPFQQQKLLVKHVFGRDDKDQIARAVTFCLGILPRTVALPREVTFLSRHPAPDGGFAQGLRG